MIEAARVLVPTVLTAANVNAQLAALNTRTGASVPLLDTTTGVQTLWRKTVLDLPHPGLGYLVGPLREETVNLKHAGLNRTERLPLWIEYVSPRTTEDAALQAAALTHTAVLYVLEGLEGLQTDGVNGRPSWTPLAGVALIAPVATEIWIVDATDAGTVIGFRARYDLTVDDVRS